MVRKIFLISMFFVVTFCLAANEKQMPVFEYEQYLKESSITYPSESFVKYKLDNEKFLGSYHGLVGAGKSLAIVGFVFMAGGIVCTVTGISLIFSSFDKVNEQFNNFSNLFSAPEATINQTFAGFEEAFKELISGFITGIIGLTLITLSTMWLPGVIMWVVGAVKKKQFITVSPTHNGISVAFKIG